MNDKSEHGKAVRIDGWGFEGNLAGHRGGLPLIGLFLIVLGLFLAAGQLFKEAQVGASAFFLAVGIVMVVAGVRDRSDLALYAGVFVTALALSDLFTGMGLIHGQGWGTLFLGLGLVFIALVRSTGSRIGWALGIGLLLALWGGSEVAAANLNFAADRLIGPLLIVFLGIYIVTRNRGARTY
jgi:hypothetical protein